MERYTGSKGFLYLAELGAEVDVGSLVDEKFYKITAKGAASAFPANTVVGAIIYNKPAIALAEGDKARPVTLTKVGFATNVPQGASKEKFENTTQIDPAKSYEEGDKPEITGNVDGYFTDDICTDKVLSRFFVLVDDSGAGVRTYKRVETGPLHFFLGRHETTTVGKTEVMEYLPVIVDSLTLDKPMQGPQPFNFNYTAIGSEQPCIYRRTITA